MLMFDFTCEPCAHTFERLVKSGTRTVGCPQCGGPANRIISPVRFKLEGVSGDFPTAYDRWTRIHEEAGKKQRERDHDEINSTIL